MQVEIKKKSKFRNHTEEVDDRWREKLGSLESHAGHKGEEGEGEEGHGKP